MQKKKKDRATTLLVAPMVIWTVLFVGVTMGYVLLISFLKRAPEGIGFIWEFTLDNYKNLLRPDYLQVLWESIKLALETTVFCVLLGYPFGYCMARASKKWRNILMLLVIVPFWTNALIRVYGWKILLMGDGIINNFLQWLGLIDRPLKLLNTYGAGLLGMVYALIPFMILPTYSAVEKMDWSLVEAARDMGASRARAFLTITLPMTASGLLSGCVLVFVPAIGLFFMSDLLGGSMELYVGNLVRDQLLKARDWPFAAAISVVLLVLVSAILYAYRRAGGKSSDMTLF